MKIQSTASEVNSLETAVVTKPLDYTNINITLEACGLLCSVKQATSEPVGINVKMVISLE